jgi:hypothetical protein
MKLAAVALKFVVSAILPEQEGWEVGVQVVQSISLMHLSEFLIWRLSTERAYHYLMKVWKFEHARS